MKVLRTLLRPLSNSERRRFAVEEAHNIDTTNEDEMDNRSAVEEPKVSEVTIMLVVVSTRFLVLISYEIFLSDLPCAIYRTSVPMQ